MCEKGADVKKRLETLKRELSLDWGELATRLGISRSMLDQTRKSKRSFGPQIMRRLIQTEIEAGLTPPRPLKRVPPAAKADPEARHQMDLGENVSSMRLYIEEEFNWLHTTLEGMKRDIEKLKKGGQ